MPEDTMFQEAVEALRQGDKARAKDILTRLLRTAQHDVNYWIWLSAAVDTPKERIYCLQTALKLDPENATAKRGLILLGALPPDENVRPFPLNRPRAWEEELTLAHEQARAKGFKAFASSPMGRLAGLALLGVAVCALAIFGLLTPRGATFGSRTVTPGPSPTFTATPTLIGAQAATPTFVGPTPLWALLPATYTPTPLYVSTPRQPQSGDLYRVAKRAYEQGDWETFIDTMEQIAVFEPEAADVHYMIGEAYRFQADYKRALEAYNRALEINPDFGPAYVGLARARLGPDPNAEVLFLLDQAIEKDPNFGEAYLQRAIYHLAHNDPTSAISDLTAADARLPDSPLVYLYLAQAYLELGDNEKALTAARRANELDLTMLPTYLILGQTYIAASEYAAALGPLQTYTLYEPNDAQALTLLGTAYNGLGDHRAALETLDRAIAINFRIGQARLQRGLAYVELGEGELAEIDLKEASGYLEPSFELSFALSRAYYLQEQYGSTYLQLEDAESLAQTDEQLALVFYWRALAHEHRRDLRAAAEDWQSLLDLPPAAMTAEMRSEAFEHLYAIRTPTPTRTPARVSTKTPTPTPKGGKTPTPTPTRTPTPTP